MFFINVPIGVLLVLGFLFLLPRAQETVARKRLRVDAIGLLEFIGAIVSLMYAMTIIADNPAQALNPLVWALFVVAAVLAVGFVIHVRSTPEPIMEYRLLARSPFLAANAYNFLLGAVSMGFYSFVPYYAVIKYGLTPYESGAVLTPRALVVVATSTIASLYVKRLGYRAPMLLGMALVGVSLVMLAQGWFSVSIFGLSIQGFWLLAAIIAIGGLGMGVANPASSNAAIDQLPDKAASITGIRGTFRLAGGTISISCIVLALSFFADKAQGLDVIFLVFTGVLLVSVPLVLMIPEAGGLGPQPRLRAITPEERSRPVDSVPRAANRIS